MCVMQSVVPSIAETIVDMVMWSNLRGDSRKFRRALELEEVQFLSVALPDRGPVWLWLAGNMSIEDSVTMRNA